MLHVTEVIKNHQNYAFVYFFLTSFLDVGIKSILCPLLVSNFVSNAFWILQIFFFFFPLFFTFSRVVLTASNDNHLHTRYHLILILLRVDRPICPILYAKNRNSSQIQNWIRSTNMTPTINLYITHAVFPLGKSNPDRFRNNCQLT